MKNNILIALILLCVFVVIDVCLRMFYCGGFYMAFNSQEFNNIASPLISFFGFIGLIITAKIALNQFKLQQSVSYFDYYKTLINKILQDNTQGISTIELLDFVSYSDTKYSDLKRYPSYIIDLEKFKKGDNVTSNGKEYDQILAQIRLFRIKLMILLKRYELLLIEIRDHKQLEISHKDLLFRELFANQILNYFYGLKMVETEIELIDVKQNLYIAFMNHSKEQLPFYDASFYELKLLIEKDINLQKYLNIQID